jgi:methyl-accepting chemotaxis protein
MENISAIAQDNLATVEEMSKATDNLAQQAEPGEAHRGLPREIAGVASIANPEVPE